MSDTHKVIIGTRGSKLALWQANWVADQLRGLHAGLDVQLHIITTAGDRIQNVPLQSVGDDGFWVKEIEAALLSGEIDLAVHSLKDLPHAQPEGLVVPIIPPRADPRDILISRDNLQFEALRYGATVGTSSTRRASQLLAVRPDLNIIPVRGNVDTRIRKLHDPMQGYDAIVLAAAGVTRLERGDEISQFLPMDVMLPAPGQGALGLECRSDDARMRALLAPMDEPNARAAVECEKAFLARLGGGCQTPAAAFCTIDEGKVNFKGFVGSPDGRHAIHVRRETYVDTDAGAATLVAAAIALGHDAADDALSDGAARLLADARAAGYVTPRA